jgi:hypothetical protein
VHSEECWAPARGRLQDEVTIARAGARRVITGRQIFVAITYQPAGLDRGAVKADSRLRPERSDGP